MHSMRTSTFETFNGAAVVSQDTHWETLCATSSATETDRRTLVLPVGETEVELGEYASSPMLCPSEEGIAIFALAIGFGAS